MIDADVQIIDYTGIGYNPANPATNGEYAARLLAFTKNTRLELNPEGFEAWLGKPWEEIEAELSYMANTIPSSWEFVDITFSLRNVTRACAQQITRTRYTPIDVDIFGSYAMQSQRVTDMAKATYHIPEGLSPRLEVAYREDMDDALAKYVSAVEHGMPLEDARGLLPMNLHCNLVAKYNLRALAELFRKRDSLRVQGEFVEIVSRMKGQVLRVWPWAKPFFIPKQSAAITIIEAVAKGLDADNRRELAKAADLLKV